MLECSNICYLAAPIAFFVGTIVEKECVILWLVLECGIVTPATSLHLSLFAKIWLSPLILVSKILHFL